MEGVPKEENILTKEMLDTLFSNAQQRLSELHDLASMNQQRRIRGEISGQECDKEDAHIQKTIQEVEAERDSILKAAQSIS